jgi:ribosome recycling factor
MAPFEKGLRVIFPDLTSERREQFAKVVRNKLEEGRVSLRGLRDKTWKEIEEREKAGGMGEDDKFRLKEELQKLIDEANQKLEALAEKKEIEIKS